MPTVPEAVRPPRDIPPRADLGEWARIRARIVVTDRDWVYVGALSDDGYGRFWLSSSAAQPAALPTDASGRQGEAAEPLQLSLWPVTESSATAGRVVRPSRWMWQAYNGPIPDAKVIRHACDRSWCTRPECLLLGEQVDNLADAVRRDRVTHPGRVGKADRRGAAAAARAVRSAVLDAVLRCGMYDPAELGAVVTGVLAAGDPFSQHGRMF